MSVVTVPHQAQHVSEGVNSAGPRWADAPAGTQNVLATQGLLVLAGVYAAISPWVVGFAVTDPSSTVNDVIVGLVVAAVGLRFFGAGRDAGLSWVAVPLGVWLLISQWIIYGSTATGTSTWSNVIIGIVTIVVGAAAAGLAMTAASPRR